MFMYMCRGVAIGLGGLQLVFDTFLGFWEVAQEHNQQPLMGAATQSERPKTQYETAHQASSCPPGGATSAAGSITARGWLDDGGYSARKDHVQSKRDQGGQGGRGSRSKGEQIQQSQQGSRTKGGQWASDRFSLVMYCNPNSGWVRPALIEYVTEFS